MVTKVVMPKLSLTMKEGTVGKWYKKEGDKVNKDEPIVEVISEKATYDLEAPASGILRKIFVEGGVDVPVNAILAVITDPTEVFLETEMPEAVMKPVAGTEKSVPASPAAKRLAREQGIDLSLVKSSGSEGRVSEEDVERFIGESHGTLPRVKETVRLTGFRKISAERLSASFRTAPHSTVMMEVDVSRAADLHDRLKVAYTAILVKAVGKALIEHPMINSSLDGDQIRIFEDSNVGIAVATENGLVVPVIRKADRETLAEIDKAIDELTAKARQAKLTKEDLSGGTFTITNLGMYGVSFFTPIINLREAAILGVGAINEKPVVTDGKIEIKPLMMLSLSYDHRIVDGAPAAEFLQKVKEKIEKVSDLEG
jgi:pyruvate dehydrogenase E2 component (dihydrolipoamide acetyltransferase)